MFPPLTFPSTRRRLADVTPPPAGFPLSPGAQPAYDRHPSFEGKGTWPEPSKQPKSALSRTLHATTYKIKKTRRQPRISIPIRRYVETGVPAFSQNENKSPWRASPPLDGSFISADRAGADAFEFSVFPFWGCVCPLRTAQSRTRLVHNFNHHIRIPVPACNPIVSPPPLPPPHVRRNHQKKTRKNNVLNKG